MTTTILPIFSAARTALLAVRARRARRHQFLARQFAVAIFIQLLKRGRGMGDLGGIDDPVLVCIQHRNNRRRRPTLAVFTA